MTHIYIGCDKIFGSRDAYFSQLGALEVLETFNAGLTPKRLDDWRTRSPRGFAFTMQALRGVTHPIDNEEDRPAILKDQDLGAFGLLRDTDAVRAAWDATLAMAEHLGPKVIVIETPIEFSPARRHREQLEWFATELAPKWRGDVAWKPHGLWEPEEAIELCGRLKLVPIFDPFEKLEVRMKGRTAYFRLFERRGLRNRFDDFDMEELLDLCEGYQRAFIIFKGAHRFRDARLCQTVLESRQAE